MKLIRSFDCVFYRNNTFKMFNIWQECKICRHELFPSFHKILFKQEVLSDFSLKKYAWKSKFYPTFFKVPTPTPHPPPLHFLKTISTTRVFFKKSLHELNKKHNFILTAWFFQTKTFLKYCASLHYLYTNVTNLQNIRNIGIIRSSTTKNRQKN